GIAPRGRDADHGSTLGVHELVKAVGEALLAGSRLAADHRVGGVGPGLQAIDDFDDVPHRRVRRGEALQPLDRTFDVPGGELAERGGLIALLGHAFTNLENGGWWCLAGAGEAEELIHRLLTRVGEWILIE